MRGGIFYTSGSPVKVVELFTYLWDLMDLFSCRIDVFFTKDHFPELWPSCL